MLRQYPLPPHQLGENESAERAPMMLGQIELGAARRPLSCALSAVREAESGVKVATLRARLRAELPIAELSQRQIKALHGLIEHEPAGFEGGLTNAKYCSTAGGSRATASRDLADLACRGLLRVGDESGRSTRYFLVTEPSV